jgi:hypothetical protein
MLSKIVSAYVFVSEVATSSFIFAIALSPICPEIKL